MSDRSQQTDRACLPQSALRQCDMEIADRIRLELPFGWFVTLCLRQAADVAAADDRARYGIVDWRA